MMYFVVPPYTTDLQDADWAVHVMPMSVPAYKRVAAQLGWKSDAKTIEKIRGNPQQDDNIPGAATEDDAKQLREGITYTTNTDGVIVWEVYRKRDDGVWEVYTYSPAAVDLDLRDPMELPYEHNQLPFVDFPYEIKDKGWFSPRGVCEILAAFELSMTAMWNHKHDAMTLDSAGRLGVGTTSPSAALDVSSSGGVQFKLTSTSSSAGLQAFTSAGSFAVSAMDFTSSATIFYTGNGTAGSAERARIDSSGNLLVGQTSAATTGSGVWIYNQNSNQGRLNITKTASGTLNAIANYHSGTYIGGVDYSNTATSFPTSSDIRLKKDIEDAGDASEKVQQIRVVTHGWKHDDATVEFGVIAQELYAVAPQAVTPGDDGEEVERTWAVDYSKLVPMLIKAHQEQQALIQSLTQRIAALEGAQA